VESSVDGLVQPSPALETLNGPALRDALHASATWLEAHAEAINALNVFPVPDGDTGLNLSLTLRSAVDAIPSPAPSSAGEVSVALAHGALMGARGNSGVILAELLRAASTRLRECTDVDATAIAEALEAGRLAAYRAVERPVEGTVLTVAREAAAVALQAARDSSDLRYLFEAVHEAARQAVKRSPEQLEILRRASVVDAGGEGLRVIFEGILRHLRGESVDLGPARIEVRADLSSLHDEGDDRYGYCTEVLLQAPSLDIPEVRTRLQQMGTCVVVVGDAELLKIHVHTPEPGNVLNLATSIGEMVKVKIDNMQLQHEAFARAAPGIATSTRSSASSSTGLARTAGTALVAVTIGDGFAQLFESLGAVVVEGGQTMNPSVDQIVRAIDATRRDQVIVLPNDRNVRLAAEQASRLRPERTILILPTEDLPRGVAAALALNPDAGAQENLPHLQSAAERCHTLQLTRAVRDATLDGLTIARGALLALLDGRAVTSADRFPELASRALDRLPSGNYEIATIYPGIDALPADTKRLGEVIHQQLGVEVSVQPGGQPHYDYVVGIE
jgi:uncharacterized protein